jgi:hypothetical protein
LVLLTEEDVLQLHKQLTVCTLEHYGVESRIKARIQVCPKTEGQSMDCCSQLWHICFSTDDHLQVVF